MGLWSIADVVANKSSNIPQARDAPFPEDKKKTLNILSWYMFFGLIWIVCFISAKTNFVTMMSVCTYYFSTKDG